MGRHRQTRTSAWSLTAITAALSAVSVMAIMAIGGWMSRWISDDGLIVLRTVENLLAGNGPVFNAGERIETNTSTLWQYVIYVVALITNAELEYIALWCALIFTVAALGIATVATTKLYGWRTQLFLFPVGGLIYVALPPARDFATSGLEWGLSLLWVSIHWALLVWWVTRKDLTWVVYAIAFWSGLSWLIRPELALYGGLTGILLLLASRNFRQVGGILLVALPVPAAYQIFRMGFYGLMTPHTAVAKNASDALWWRGFDYLAEFNAPYWLFIPSMIVLIMAAVQVLSQRLPRRSFKETLRSPVGIITLMVGTALLHILYVLRVGGDFMHGRMWLIPLFAALLPVMVMPIAKKEQGNWSFSPVLIVGTVLVTVWSITVLVRGTNHINQADYEHGELTIVDEREFWTNATRREPGDPPLHGNDYLASPGGVPLLEGIERGLEEDAALLAYEQRKGNPEGPAYVPYPRFGGDTPLTMYYVNLGFTGVHAPLEMRVLDPIGLSSPIAARQPRDPEGRVGHDKWLSWEWQFADSDADLRELPEWVDLETTIQARLALQDPEIAELLATSREPLTTQRFWENFKFSLGGGRSLEIAEDPAEYLDAQTLEEIAQVVQESHENPDAILRIFNN